MIEKIFNNVKKPLIYEVFSDIILSGSRSYPNFKEDFPMKIIKPSYEILTPISKGGVAELKRIETAARTCYKSEDKITKDGTSARKMVKALITRGHEAMLEHSQLSVKFICDRGVTHEMVRHRICSFAQESTRYCNYSGDKFGNELTFIEPFFFKDNPTYYNAWKDACKKCEDTYMYLIAHGVTPQEARSVLPNSLKTEIVVTANYREWRSIFKLRCAKDAHPQIREVMIPLQKELAEKLPEVFDIPDLY
jgi:thymidylate synthase (FAD)